MQGVLFTHRWKRIEKQTGAWYNSRRAVIMISMPFFPPLARQPKNMANYTPCAAHTWYND